MSTLHLQAPRSQSLVVVCALLAIVPGAAWAASAHQPTATRTASTKKTPNVRAGGKLTVRATRLSSTSVRVTFKLTARPTRPTDVSFFASPCTHDGCGDTNTRAGRAFALPTDGSSVTRTLTLTGRSARSIVCVAAQASDVGQDGLNIKGFLVTTRVS